jgi:hypothetical protein
VFCLFLGGSGGFGLAKQALYGLCQTSSGFCFGYFADGGLTNYLPGLVLNCDSLDLSLPSS